MRVDTEDEVFDKHEVWRAAWTRLLRKMLALVENKKTIAMRNKSRGEETPDMSEWGAAMTPLGRLKGDTGYLELDKNLVKKVRELYIK